MTKITTKQIRKDYKRAAEIRIFIFNEDQSVYRAIENMEGRKPKVYTVFRKYVISEVLKQAGLPEDAEVKWSRTAGCSCGCSPGFVVRGRYAMSDTFVDVADFSF